jgi:hypothetical protein
MNLSLDIALSIAPYILAIFPGSWLIRRVLRFTPLSPEHWKAIDEHLILGEWIGVFERWIVIFLAGIGEWSALGFVIAAKGLLRLPQLRARENEHDSSYVFSSYTLLGTLISLSLAVGLAELAEWMRCWIECQ